MHDPWQIWLASPPAAVHFDPGAQSFEDQRRWQRLHGSRDREDWKVSRALLAHVRPGEVPRSLSHSGGHAALAIGPPGALVGVDIERIDERRDCLRLARFAFADEEAEQIGALPADARTERFYVLWTLKEACIKALGLTLLDGLRRCVFTVHGERWRAEIPTGSRWAARVYRPRPSHYLGLFAITPDGEPQWSENEWPQPSAVSWPRPVTLVSTQHQCR